MVGTYFLGVIYLKGRDTEIGCFVAQIATRNGIGPG